MHDDSAEVERGKAVCGGNREEDVAKRENNERDGKRAPVADPPEDERHEKHEHDLPDLADVHRRSEIPVAGILKVSGAVDVVPLERNHREQEDYRKRAERPVAQKDERAKPKRVAYRYRRSPRLRSRPREDKGEKTSCERHSRASREYPRRRVECLESCRRCGERKDARGNPAKRSEYAYAREGVLARMGHCDSRRERPCRHVEEHHEEEHDEEKRRRSHEERPSEQRRRGEVAYREHALGVETTVREHADERRGERAYAHNEPAPKGPVLAALQ